ncbi:hypothetical protein ACHAXT_007084 [Thalassiosira profunda]
MSDAADAREDYVRVKRKNQIFFVHTSPNDTFAHVKSEIAQAVGDDDVSPEKMRLFVEPKADAGDAKAEGKGKAAPKGPIPDEAKLSDHEVQDGDVLFVTFATGDDDWEEIEVAQP